MNQFAIEPTPVHTVPSVIHLQTVWSNLSTADREVILGHSREALSPADCSKLMNVVALRERNATRVS